MRKRIKFDSEIKPDWMDKMELYDLTTEYAAEPLAVENRNPRFAWKCRAGQDFFQREYRILVLEHRDLQTDEHRSPVADGRPEKSAAERRFPGDLLCWDSGIVRSSQSVGVRYGGAPLKARTRYDWRVISNGVESPVSSFETAPWEDSLWWGRWIGMPMNFAGQTVLLRTEFEIPPEKSVVRARAYVAGLGCHEAFLNGWQIGCEKLNPSVSCYEKRIYYNAYALEVVPGKNVFGLELGYGWFGSRMAFAQIFVDFGDGSVLHRCTQSGEDWWTTGGAVVSNSIYGGERYDARLEIPNWCTAEYRPNWDCGWMYSVGVAPLSGKLCAQSMEGMIVAETFPGRVLRRDGNRTIFDLGQNISGWARIRVRGEKGARILLRFAERLDEHGELNRLNLRSAANEDEYVLRGGGEEEWAPRFTYHGFQFAEARIEGRAELLSLCGEHVRNGVRRIGDFSCSDETLNRLHELAFHTESNNLQGVMTDCPQRDERFGWLNDLTARIWQAANNFDYSRFLPKFVRDITDSQGADGSIPDTVPHFVGGRPADPVGGYLILALADYVLSGDREILRENYDGFKKWMAFLESRLDEDGTLGIGSYGDWVPAAPYTRDGGECPFSAVIEPACLSAAYFVWYQGMMAKIARAIGEEGDAEAFTERREELIPAYLKKYGDRRGQTVTAISLTAGIRTDRIEASAELAADVAENGWHMTCGNQGYRHLLEWLGECGQSETAIRLLKNPEYPGWGYMLERGATTVWERWEDGMKNLMHSYNHPMFASYDSFFFRHLAGLRISGDAEGADRFTVAPQIPDGIEWAKASLSTVRGTASTVWKRTGRTVCLTVKTPANTRLTVRVPGRLISVNGTAFRGRCAELGNGSFEIIFETKREERQ